MTFPPLLEKKGLDLALEIYPDRDDLRARLETVEVLLVEQWPLYRFSEGAAGVDAEMIAMDGIEEKLLSIPGRQVRLRHAVAAFRRYLAAGRPERFPLALEFDALRYAAEELYPDDWSLRLRLGSCAAQLSNSMTLKRRSELTADGYDCEFRCGNGSMRRKSRLTGQESGECYQDMSQPGNLTPLKFLSLSQLDCQSIVTALTHGARVTRLANWAEGISVFEVPDVIYLPEYGIPVCFGFVPEEAIKFPEHLDHRLSDPGTPDNPIINLDLIERSSAEVCVLGVMYSHVFGHWLEELLKVVALEKFGFDGFYVFPDWFPPFCHDSLCHLGVPPTRILAVDRPVRYKKGFLTTTIHHFNANKFPKLISHLRDLLYERTPPDEVGVGPRIWAERGQNANGRHLINEEEVYACIKRYDFTRIDFSQYTFSQQIGIDREIKIMAGPHGSAFVHCSFMKSRGKVVEIFGYYPPDDRTYIIPPNSPVLACWPIAQACPR
jgi:hypothetical protein